MIFESVVCENPEATGGDDSFQLVKIEIIKKPKGLESMIKTF